MNNNRGNNNNRRRGRGNRQNGGGGGGGGQQLNRIDSRARGNAPQLLEKYRKLAQDAHLNGDRVQAEYYLQFADHYFRVIADQRLRQDEQRGRPQGERWQEGGDEGEDSGEFSSNSDFPSFDQPSFNRPQRAQRPQQDEQDSRDDRDDGAERAEEAQADEAGEDNSFEPAENPFLRENRNRGGLRPRRDRAPRDDRGGGRESRSDDAPAGLDPASLPPAISASRGAEETEAKPKKRAPRRKPSAGDAGETLETVG